MLVLYIHNRQSKGREGRRGGRRGGRKKGREEGRVKEEEAA